MPRRRRQHSENSSELESTNRTTESRQRSAERRQGARWLRRLGWLFIGLLILIAILPNLIGWTSMHQPLINWALKDFHGTIKVNRLSIGWFQTLRLDGVEVNDSAGESLAQIETVRSSKRLFQFLTQSSLGEFEILRPQLHLLTREGGSNVEDAIAKLIDKPQSSESNSPLPQISVKVVDGTVTLASQRQPQAWNLSHLNAAIHTATTSAITARVTADVNRDQSFGKLDLDIALDEQKTEILIDNGRMHLLVEEIAVGCLAPILERVVGVVDLAGEFNGDVLVEFQKGGEEAKIQVQNTSLTDLHASAPKYLGSDILRMSKLVAFGKIDLTTEGGNADGLEVSCDFGRVTTNGQFNWSQLTRIAEQPMLVETPFQLNGQIDLARLTKMLPKTFQLYDDLNVESGEVNCQVHSRPEQGAGRLVVNLDTANLVAVRNGQRLAWQQPLRIVSVVSQRGSDWSIDEFKCESDFLTITGKADQKTGAFETRGDLSILMQRLSQFVDLRGCNVKGVVDGKFGWDVAPSDPNSQTGLSLVNVPLEFSGEFKIDRPTLALPGMQPWSDSELKATVSGLATALVNGSAKIDSGDAQVTIGGERVRLVLAESVADIMTQKSWTAHCAASGRLARWLDHAGVVCDLSFLNTDGQTQITGLLKLDEESMQFTSLKYQIKNWRFVGYGMNIDEPEASGEGNLAFDFGTGVLTFPEVTLVCSSIAARGDKIAIAYDTFLNASGGVAFRADTHRVLNWLDLFTDPAAIHYFGGLEGNISFTSDATEIHGNLTGKATDFVVAQPQPQTATTAADWQTLLREPVINFQTEWGFKQDFDHVTFSGLKVVGSSVQVTADGSLADLAGTLITEVHGTWSPDWVKVQGLLDAYAYNSVKLAGRQQQNFSVQGPVFSKAPETVWPPRDLKVVTQVGWEHGNVFMLPVGAATVNAGLVEGQAVLQTGDIPFSQGTVSFSPHCDLNDPKQMAILDAGPMLTNVTLTPEICRDWMKFVAPLVADVTAAEGKISVASKGFQLPLTDYTKVEGRGEITLSDVTLGAGPLGKELISTVESLRMMLKPNATPDTRDRSVWLRLEPQTVPIAVANGRVHHQQMRIKVKDVTMTTSGSVGFDQSVSMIAEIPILDEWVSGEKWLEALKGETIKIPITGTLTKPTFDRGAIQQLTMQVAQRAATSKITEQTEKLQGKLGTEFGKAQQKIGGELEKVQNKINDSVQGDLMKGIGNLFGPKKDQ